MAPTTEPPTTEPGTVACSHAVPYGQHTCGIVGFGYERLRMVSGFVRSGLLAGDRVWCFPNGSRSEVLDWLHRNDVAEDEAIASGQLTVLPTQESTLCYLDSDPDMVLDGLRRAVDDALDAGWNGFRMVGDLGWAIREQCCPRSLIEFEERIGEILAGSPAATLCQYDRYRFDAATMITLTEMHAAVMGTVQGGEQFTCSPLDELPGLRLAGELDLATRDAFITALEEAMSDTDDLHLELSELTFVDSGGAQVMLRFAERLPSGNRIVLHWPPPSLRIALDLLWNEPKLIDAEGEWI
ncbi:MAG: MEDS domain-containing protein [Pseudonocardiaceae bacterium]